MNESATAEVLPNIIPDEIAINIDSLKRKAPKVDIREALSLRLQKGLSYREIGAIQNVSKQAVSAALRKYARLINSPDQLKAYKTHRSDLLSAAEMEMVTSMVDAEKLQKAGVHQLAGALRELTTARRLEDNQSTEITAATKVLLNWTDKPIDVEPE